MLSAAPFRRRAAPNLWPHGNIFFIICTIFFQHRGISYPIYLLRIFTVVRSVFCRKASKKETKPNFRFRFFATFLYFYQFRSQHLSRFFAGGFSFHGLGRLFVEQIDKRLFLRPQATLVRIDQDIPHLLALGRAFLQHQMILFQRLAGHG